MQAPAQAPPAPAHVVLTDRKRARAAAADSDSESADTGSDAASDSDSGGSEYAPSSAEAKKENKKASKSTSAGGALAARDAEIRALRAENGRLRAALAAAGRPAPAGAAGAAFAAPPPAGAPPPGPEFAARILRALKAAINAQMVDHLQALEHGRSRVAAVVPILDRAGAAAVPGAELVAKATEGPKRVAVLAGRAALEALDLSFAMSLRYGACPALKDGLKFAWSAETGVLKATGA